MGADPVLFRGRVASQHEIHPGFFWLELACPPGIPPTTPGQYLNLRIDSDRHLFRRPFGVVGERRRKGEVVLELFYAVVGSCTAAMARWAPGDPVDCLGPLGAGYAVERSRPALLIAGGRGAAPLLYLNQRLLEAGHPEVRVAFGVREKGLLFGLERLDPERLLLASDDGSVGFHGTVLQALEAARPEWLAGEPVLYACGPEVLLAAVARLAEARGLDAQVSLEGVYGCGVGLCRGCAVPLREESRYLMQCIEGPVVAARRIDWECLADG